MSKFLLLLASAALVLGCGDQPAPAEPAAAAGPSLRTVQNPDGPGAFAIHIPEASFLTGGDPDNPNLTALVGATFAEHVRFCETGEPPFPMDRLLVFRPDGSIKTRVQGAQVPLVIWQTAPSNPTDDPFADVCTEEFLALPHLDGTAQFLDRDNDLTLSGNRANAFGFHIIGQVRSEAGQRFKFLGKARSLILRDGEFRNTFELRLTPIGQ